MKQKSSKSWVALRSSGTKRQAGKNSIGRLAAFIVEHWEKRRAAMEGKATVLTMSRDIAARLYEAIRTLRPDWHDIDDERGAMKVVVTGTNEDPEPLRNHVRTKAARKRLAERFKAPHDDLRLVIVCDMWLTGFDCPPAHTMYLDKPLAGHNLMQAIARVNRVYGDKPGGLIVDLLGLADQLADALATYTQAGGTGEAVRKVQNEAVRRRPSRGASAINCCLISFQTATRVPDASVKIGSGSPFSSTSSPPNRSEKKTV